MTRWVGFVPMFAGVVAFATPRLNFGLSESVSIPTLPSDILGCMLILAGLAKGMYWISTEPNPLHMTPARFNILAFFAVQRYANGPNVVTSHHGLRLTQCRKPPAETALASHSPLFFESLQKALQRYLPSVICLGF
ncbi:hypothetical protein [Bradyrhizobium sp.]|uniref:hypothetical protein n=1 Tax=Bradyrhizobium sp. TaxID=376 RepID=UPI001E008622|nr:hypothetical protein [Bradyrhizobium sp.]MBV8701840.1 hypothetical protein [Bradyrhizobium sp.]MBV8922550.1 hypothetical protein [Bradyrhizobium sp.]MBV9981577.1 hypothetical protein [Bradyrhizobium sp.]